MCQWVKDLLVRNGVSTERITVSRQGLCPPDSEQAVPPSRSVGDTSPLRMMFVGRLDPTKGIHVLVEALKGAPDLPVTLDIYGVTQSDAGASYLQRLKQSAESDRRVRFRHSIPSDEVVTRMRGYDVLAVPSQWLETGPLVVMEAFAAGLPVVGSNLGGISELVTNGVDGLLVEPGSIAGWRHALERLCRDSTLLHTLRGGVRPPRRITDVAIDMSVLYSRVLGGLPRLSDGSNGERLVMSSDSPAPLANFGVASVRTG
jgi:glycosyltransferase involved in cell wall biosynthesis